MAGIKIVSDRVDHQLAAQRRSALVAYHQCGDSDHIPARAVTPDNKASGVRLEFARMLAGPLGRRVTVRWSCWKFVLRRQPVIDRNHDAPGGVAHVATDAVVRVETAEHKTAAVKEHHQRERRVAIGPVDAYRQIASW